MAKNINSKVNSDLDVSGNTKYLPDRDTKIAELTYYKAGGEWLFLRKLFGESLHNKRQKLRDRL